MYLVRLYHLGTSVKQTVLQLPPLVPPTPDGPIGSGSFISKVDALFKEQHYATVKIGSPDIAPSLRAAFMVQE